jgi:hypothetical protein
MSFLNLGTPPPRDIYPPWPMTLIELVDRALAIAWGRLKAQYPAVIATQDEDKITDQLITELVGMRKNDFPPGFNSHLFGVPIRDGKVKNWSGKSIDQMPDITIYLAHPRSTVADDRYDAIFFECKVLKRKSNLNLYRKNGILRFINGQYAWSMPHAGMIGYTFSPTHQCPITSLTAYFSRKVKSVTIGNTLGCFKNPVKALSSSHPSASDTATTIHKRPYNASEIDLRHLWFT